MKIATFVVANIEFVFEMGMEMETLLLHITLWYIILVYFLMFHTLLKCYII